jgi:copper chaperone CopZ
MKKSELRSIIRECVQEALTEVRLMNNFGKFSNTLPAPDRNEFIALFGPYLGVPIEAGHEIEDISTQLKKIDGVIKILPTDKKKKYVAILNDFKKFVVDQAENQVVAR